MSRTFGIPFLGKTIFFAMIGFQRMFWNSEERSYRLTPRHTLIFAGLSVNTELAINLGQLLVKKLVPSKATLAYASLVLEMSHWRRHWHWNIKAVLNVLMHCHCKYWEDFMGHLVVWEPTSASAPRCFFLGVFCLNLHLLTSCQKTEKRRGTALPAVHVGDFLTNDQCATYFGGWQ